MNLEYMTAAACVAAIALALFSNAGLGTAMSNAVSKIGATATCALTPQDQRCREKSR